MSKKAAFSVWSPFAFQQSPKDLSSSELEKGSAELVESSEYFHISPTYVLGGGDGDNPTDLPLILQYFGPMYGCPTPAGDYTIWRAEVPPGDGLVSRLPDPNPGREEILPGDGLVSRLPYSNPALEDYGSNIATHYDVGTKPDSNEHITAADFKWFVSDQLYVNDQADSARVFHASNAVQDW
jgi:hypothetical protein